jgi:hypothetical protein
LVYELTKNIAVGAIGATEEGMKYVGAINELKGATDRLKLAQESWMKGAGSDIATELEKQGVTGQKAKDALGAIDAIYGTSYSKQAAYKEDTVAIVKAYKEGGEDALPKFMAGLATLKTDWMDQSEAIQAVRTEVINLQSSLDLLVSKSYVVGITTITGQSGTNSNNNSAKISSGNSADKYTDPLKGPGGANGMDFIVPPGYPNDSFPFRAQSGERVTVTPANQISNNMGGITIYVSGAGDPKAVADAMALRLASYGKQYQGM